MEMALNEEQAKAFAELVDAFDTDIDEMGLIPPPCSQIVVLVENKLGISMDFLKPLFRFCMSEYNKLRSIVKAHDDYLCFLGGKSLWHLASVTQAMLAVRGDLPMIFNTRKQLIENKIINCDKELAFLRVLFTHHPKSPSAWEHRRYCLKYKFFKKMEQFSDEQDVDFFLTENEYKEELRICTDSAERYSKNYYAWLHRLWLLNQLNLLPSGTKVNDDDNNIQMTIQYLQDEIHAMEKWLMSHTSDHCAANHLLQALSKLCILLNQMRAKTSSIINDDILKSRSNSLSSSSSSSPCSSSSSTTIRDSNETNQIKIADNENASVFEETKALKVILMALEGNDRLIIARPGSESLWYCRRGITKILFKVSYDNLINVQSIIDNNNYYNNNNINLNKSKEAKNVRRMNGEKNHLQITALHDFVRAEILHSQELTMTNTYQDSNSNNSVESLHPQPTIVWNHEKQSLYGNRYIAAFLLMSMEHLTSCQSFYENDLRRESVNIELLRESHEHFKLLCSQLVQQDSMPRCWKYFA